MAPCPVCAEKLRLPLLVSGRFSCPRCRAPLQSNARFALNLAGAISGSPAVLLSLVCENFHVADRDFHCRFRSPCQFAVRRCSRMPGASGDYV